MTSFQYLMLGIGALATLCGVLILVMRIRTLASGRIVDGVVVCEKIGSHIHSSDDHKITPMSHAVFEFQHDGKTFRCESSLGKGGAISEGTRVRVRYLPSDPQNSAEIDSVGAMWGFPVMALVVGAVFIAVGLYDAGYFKQ